MMSETLEKLLDRAEARIRSDGFHAVSFRELAADLGIKSASVHYHFAKKEDLGVAVVARYADRFFANVEKRVDEGQAKLPAFIATYRDALIGTSQVCLCGVLGAESRGLPKPVQAEVGKFLSANVAWLEAAYKEIGIDRPGDQALHTLSALQGAMLIGIGLDRTQVFDSVAREVLRIVRSRAAA